MRAGENRSCYFFFPNIIHLLHIFIYFLREGEGWLPRGMLGTRMRHCYLSGQNKLALAHVPSANKKVLHFVRQVGSASKSGALLS